MTSGLPLVSIIIPCYNHGGFLLEALVSLDKQSYTNYEVIIVDDGSSDPATLEILDKLKYKATVIQQPNGGPSVARHNGIQHSKGKYLFFLDSDNLVGKEYISKGVSVMESDAAIGVVYSDVHIFGTQDEIKKSAPFDVNNLMLANGIDLCCVMRKQAYDDAGGFDTYLSKLGLEDWEIWFGVYKAGWKFHYIPEILFEYRTTDRSRTNQVANNNLDKIIPYIANKHSDLLLERYRLLYHEHKNIKHTPDYKIGHVMLAPLRFIKNLVK